MFLLVNACWWRSFLCGAGIGAVITYYANASPIVIIVSLITILSPSIVIPCAVTTSPASYSQPSPTPYTYSIVIIISAQSTYSNTSVASCSPTHTASSCY